MEPLICPECGGKVDEPKAGRDIAVCEYCSTKFRSERPPPVLHIEAPAQTYAPPSRPRQRLGSIFWAIPLLIVGVVVFQVYVSLNSTVNRTRQSVNNAQQAANSAKSAANALQEAANAFANRVRENANAPSPTPKRPKP